MESLIAVETNALPKPIIKQEMDESVKMLNESGIFSNNSTNTSNNSGAGNWDRHEGEVSDPSFDPPIASTNVRKIPPCNISSIDGQVGLNDISAKGKYNENELQNEIYSLILDGQPMNSTDTSVGLVFGFLNEKQANIYRAGIKVPRWTQDYSEKSLDSVMTSETSFVLKYEDSFTNFDNAVQSDKNILQKFPVTLNDEFEHTARMLVSRTKN